MSPAAGWSGWGWSWVPGEPEQLSFSGFAPVFAFNLPQPRGPLASSLGLAVMVRGGGGGFSVVSVRVVSSEATLLELQMQVCEDFTITIITEKAPARTFSWLKAPTS